MKSKPRRLRAEAQFDDVIESFRPLVRKTVMAIAVSRFILALIPLQLKYVLDPLLKHEDVKVFGLAVGATSILGILVGTGFLIAVVRGVADYVYVSTSGRHGHSLVARLRVLMYEHILRIPSAYARRRGTGKILLRFIGDSDALRSWYSRREPAVRVDRWLLGLLLVIMFFVDWRLTLVVLIPLPMVVMVARRIGPLLAGETLNARFKQAKLTGAIGHRFDFIYQSKWLDRHRANRERIRSQAENVADLNANRDKQAALLQGLGQFFAFSSVPLLLLAGVLLAWQGMISLGQCVAFVWLTAHLAVTIYRLNSAVVLKEKALVSKRRILKLLERTAERGRSSKNQEFVPGTRSLVLDGVQLKSSNGERLPLSAEFHDNGPHRVKDECVRPLITAILGLERIENGRIFLDQQELSTLEIGSVRRRIGWIMDRPMILPGTIRENLLLANPGLSAAQLQAFCVSFDPELNSEWLDKEAQLHGQNLTLREVKCITIFRALINDPPYIVLDVTQRDPETLALLRQVVDRYRNQAMLLMSGALLDEILGPKSRTRAILPEPRFGNGVVEGVQS